MAEDTFTAADRLQHLRELMGLPREAFAQMLGIEFSRYRNIEQKRTKLGEEEFAAIAMVLPDFLRWVVLGDELGDDFLNSQSVWTKVIAAKIEAGQSVIKVRKTVAVEDGH